MTSVGDRVAGVVSCVLAIALALGATSFRGGFYTDPLGPGGLPWLAATLIGIGGLALAIWPSDGCTWPDTIITQRMAIVFASLVSYTFLLPLFGFFLSTVAILLIMSRAFGGPFLRSAILSFLYAATLYLVFAGLLGLSLPVGSFFLISP